MSTTLEDVMRFAGIIDIVDYTSGTFSQPGYESCQGSLDTYVSRAREALAVCGSAAGLLAGEVPTVGLDTPATITAVLACGGEVFAYKNAAEALSTCISGVDSARATALNDAASTVESQYAEAVAIAEPLQSSDVAT